MKQKITTIFTSPLTTPILIFLVLLVAAVAHGYNMFGFPYYENDEGTYMSQAWSLVTQGKMAPYTYWYDHAPAGWIFIALWTELTGGFFTFGTSVNSGRVFMLVLHVLSSFFLIMIGKKVSGKLWPGLLAALIFSLSPLGIYFQRRVLLDNIMTFWMLCSLWILLQDKIRLRHVYLSAVAFGVGVLTKENAVFFIPGFLYLLYTKTHVLHRRFALISWLSVTGMIVSLYFLYAILKNELLPASFLGGTAQHVSLIQTLQEQYSRGTGLPFWEQKSDFYQSFAAWVNKDKTFMILGVLSTIVSILLSIKNKAFRLPMLLSVFFWLFLLRGKLVIEFYVVPLLPILALQIGMVSHVLLSPIYRYRRYGYYAISFLFSVYLSLLFIQKTHGHYTKKETEPQLATIRWIKENLTPGTRIAIDDYMYVDLHDRKTPDEPIFPYAEWVWKIERDPDVRWATFKNDWRNIDTITLSHEMLKQIKEKNFPLLKLALDNSVLVQDYSYGATSYRNYYNYVSTNGDWMRIYALQNTNKATLSTSWQFYKKHFIHNYGQVIDPANMNTTSEGQSYAMLRAVWENDKNTFDEVWEWTKNHLQHRSQDKLLSWLWKDNKLQDSNTASDADQDVALALILAHKRWGREVYKKEALTLINDIWEKEVIKIQGRYYLLSGADTQVNGGYLVNPSYLSPATYHLFAELDTKHPWEILRKDSYTLLSELSQESKSTTKLPPNWILVAQTGEIKSATQIMGNEAGDYGFDAFRTLWRVALDAQWFQNPDAESYLMSIAPFLEDTWKKDRSFKAIYSPSGKAVVDYNALSVTSGALSLFSITNKPLAKDIADTVYSTQFNITEGFWGDKNNYYDQNWAYFGTALYSNNLPYTFQTK